MAKMKLSEKARRARLKYQREWRAKHPGYDKAWRAKNKDKVLLAQKEWRERNPEYYKKTQKERTEYLRAYLKRNPEKRRQYEVNKWEKMAQESEVTVKGVSVTGNKVSVTRDPGQAICLYCGNFFKPKRVTAKYCSDKCRVNFNRNKLA